MQNVKNFLKIIPLKKCSAEHYKLDKAVCAKHIATKSSVFPTGTEVRQHARRSAAQMKQRQHLAKIYLSDFTAKHLGYFNHIFRLSQLHQSDQGILPNRFS